ncbi:hypothetical protein GI482_07090 [Bacillus sp. N3536]|nr:hypothetical protein GI482_07090 [Bacillus sp. N3536]
MPLRKESYELNYRNKKGNVKKVKLKSVDFYTAEIEALEVLETNKNDINFNKKRRLELIKVVGKNRFTYDSVWKKNSPLSTNSSIGGYIEGFSKKFTKREKNELTSYIEENSKKQYKLLKPFALVYWGLSILILIDMLADFFMNLESKKIILNSIGLAGVSISLMLQSLFLMLLIISAIFQPIVYENFRDNASKWSKLKWRVFLYEVPTLVSSLSTTISLIFVKSSVIIFGNATILYVLVLLVMKILIAIQYEKDAFYKKKKIEFHNK